MISEDLIQLTEEEFKQQTSYSKNTLSIEFKNRSFKKGPTFSLAMRKQAIDYCQKTIGKSLLIEGKLCITIWLQEQITDSVSGQSESQLLGHKTQVSTSDSPTRKVSDESKTQDRTNNSQVSTKKATRVYRGRTYEVEIPDYLADRQILINKEETTTKKHRGQSISQDNSNCQPSNQQKLPINRVPTKKVTRVYRGQTYEVEIPDYSSLSQFTKNQNVDKK